jgi:hypothetical protein
LRWIRRSFDRKPLADRAWNLSEMRNRGKPKRLHPGEQARLTCCPAMPAASVHDTPLTPYARHEMKHQSLAAGLALMILLGGCDESEPVPPPQTATDPKPPAPSLITKQQARTILGKEAKQLTNTYLADRGVALFRSGSAYYAATRDRHIQIANCFGGGMGGSEVMDFDGDGRDDLLLHYASGSGMVRSGTTVILDDGKQLRVFMISGEPVKREGQWRVPHPLAEYGYGKGKAVPILRFDRESGIIATWPDGTTDDQKWTMPPAVVVAAKWVPNQPTQAEAE